MRRKKILIHSNSHYAYTGFGKNAKNILKYLYNTNKYEVFEAGNGYPYSDNPKKVPWTFYGTAPVDNDVLQSIKQNPSLSQDAAYGVFTIDNIIKNVNPDIYIGIEDIWAFREIVKKPWWNKINCMIWTTLDSLPLLPDAIIMAKDIKNYYCWSSFAENAAKNIGINHLKTLHGSIEHENFYKLDDEKRQSLRKKFNISSDSFITGFVFRNQLRKTVGDLIAGFKLFKTKYPESNPKLLLHTNWSEGWDILRLCSDFNVNPSDILTTYICHHCNNYNISKFIGHQTDCPFCKHKNSLLNVSVVKGVSEFQLNEIYNLMDMYVHPFTSGGQEIPIQEAKLTELITAATNYTCGEEMCSTESGGLPLNWSPYREIGTQFIKASTNPNDIFSKMEFVYNMPVEQKKLMGKTAREFVINNYSCESICKKLCEIIDSTPNIDFNFKNDIKKPNPNYIPNKQYKNNIEFIKDLYLNILNRNVDENDEGVKHWLGKILNEGFPHQSIINYFKDVAVKEIQKNYPLKIEDFIDYNSSNKRISLTIPNDTYIAFLLSFLIDEIKNKYQNFDLYLFCNESFIPMFYSKINKIYKILPRMNGDDNLSYLQGFLNNAGYFDLSFIVNESQLSIPMCSHNNIL